MNQMPAGPLQHHDVEAHIFGDDRCCKGNVYVVQAELTAADGKSGGTGAYKWVFEGYSPVTKSP
jgi:hypothetical protein